MGKLYLSRRNIGLLLEKLDSIRDGEASSCTIIKNDYAHPVYPQTLRRIAVTSVETMDQYFSAVSHRINLSRTTLLYLLAGLEKQTASEVEIGGMLVVAVPDEQYYAGHDASNAAPIGHVSPILGKKNGK